MNIFVLDSNPVLAAQLQCDKHAVKMPLESAQMLSTAHRMLDGVQVEFWVPTHWRVVSSTKKITKIKLVKGKYKKPHVHYDKDLDNILYNAVHINHPCTQWTMETKANYLWHYDHFVALCEEYKYRYGKTHASFIKLGEILSSPPRNIAEGNMTQFRLAMKDCPDCIVENNPVQSYRNFYKTKQDRFNMIWSKRNVPEWFEVRK
jgi:hypothetical protein